MFVKLNFALFCVYKYSKKQAFSVCTTRFGGQLLYLFVCSKHPTCRFVATNSKWELLDCTTYYVYFNGWLLF